MADSLKRTALSKIIAIANQKGGVGKTTTAVNLAASLALSGEKILLVDTDPQGNSSSGLGIEVEQGLYDVYSRGKGMKDAVRETAVDKLFIVPSSVDLLAVELELIDRQEREKVLLQSLMPVRDEYRYTLIDCPPSLGLLTLNALVAADSVMVPMQCEYYALEGLGKLTRTLKLIRGSYNPSLEIEGILLTMYDRRNTLSKQVEEEIKRHFPDKVYQTIIPRNITLAEAPSHGLPAMLYDVRSSGAQSYLGLAKEIIDENGVRQRA
jgi:chromosome partitioning protein